MRCELEESDHLKNNTKNVPMETITPIKDAFWWRLSMSGNKAAFHVHVYWCFPSILCLCVLCLSVCLELGGVWDPETLPAQHLTTALDSARSTTNCIKELLFRLFSVSWFLVLLSGSQNLHIQTVSQVLYLAVSLHHFGHAREQ